MSDEKIDHAALVAEIRDTMKRQEWLPASLGIRAADALEAAQQAPRTSVQEVLELLDAFHGDNRMSYDAYSNLHDAIATLDVQQTPAVDRQALIASLANVECWEKDDVGGWAFVPELGADRLFASDILQDAAEVEARGLEAFIERVTDDGLVQVFGGDVVADRLGALWAGASLIRSSDGKWLLSPNIVYLHEKGKQNV